MYKQLRAEQRRYRYRLRRAGEESIETLLKESTDWSNRAEATCKAELALDRHEFLRIHRLWWPNPSKSEIQIVPDHYQTRCGRAAEVGAWAISALEVLFTTLTAVYFLNVSRVAAIVVGFLTAVFIALANKGFVAPLTTTRLLEMPREALDSLVKWLKIWSVIDSILIFLLLATARASAGTFLDRIFSYIMAALSLVTPITAGILFALAMLFYWSRDIHYDVMRWEDLLRLVLNIQDECLTQLADRKITYAKNGATHVDETTPTHV